MERRFESKRDTWLSVIIFGSVIVSAGVLWPVLYFPYHWVVVPTALVCLGTIGLLLWVAFGTYYVVGSGELRIYHGPFRWSIPFSSIENIVPVRSLWSSPALSMDRFRITYQSDKEVMISPLRKQEFLRAVQPGSV